ncbi:MAG: MurR/RpiR family transcriptional regulator [Peptoniphilaceae bacterium]|nr:MurR/RpiR family transcriptional regulator [Peptoniphilaceae bacterium]MDY6018778.1 MurR/RpiR family transcriptional regulator [Anaerococcus sp.]
MNKQYESILTFIESKYEEFTDVEKIIADYFYNIDDDDDISSKTVANKLFISEAALTRFAKKLGFSGYREFSYQFKESKEKNFNKPGELQVPVLDTYQEILSKSYYLFDDRKFNKVVKKILQRRRIFIYGLGSSGLLAEEFAQRIQRIGIDAEAIRDSHQLLLNHARVNEDSLAIGITYSGKTKEVINALKYAKDKGAYTILLSSLDTEEFNQNFDQVLPMALKKNLELSNIISPQFPGMILLDILYMKILNNKKETLEIFNQTTNDLLSTTRKDEE